MEFAVLLDAPAKPVSRIQIAKLGAYSDARYGDFEITPANVASWQKNLSRLPGGEALIDFEHRSERKPRDSQAAGWITGIDLDGDRVMADARWTPQGKKAIEDEVYRFLSPVYGETQVESETLDDALPSVALTNKPYLASMPAVCLASEERMAAAVTDELSRLLELAEAEQLDLPDEQLILLDKLTGRQRKNLPAGAFVFPEGRRYPVHDISHARNALARASGKPEEATVKAAVYKRYPELKPAADGADSRREMDTDTLIKTLDLEDGADDAKILETLAALKDKAARPSKKDTIKTLEQHAAERGLKVLDAKAFDALTRNADAGQEALRRLHDQQFEHAFSSALNDPRGARVTPAEKDQLKHFYTLDADATLSLIDGREPIVQAQPSGAATLVELSADSDPQQLLAAGIHPDSVKFEQRLRRYMAENKIPESGYIKTLEQYNANEVTF